jgi:hypothetical protein
MASIPNGQLPKETLSSWSGVNLRVDPLAVDNHELLRAVNADLHTQLGVIRVRQGRQLLSATNLGAPVNGLWRHNGRRYQAAGVTLFRNFVSILTDLIGTVSPTVFPYQPLNDTITWSFIADQNTMRKDDGTTVYLWGLTAPVAAPVIAIGAAGSLSGDYSAVYTYARVVDGAVAHEGNPTPSPAPITLTADVLSVPVIASTDAQVTHIRIYRTVAGGSRYFFDQQVANTTATIASSQADDALGTEVETDNDPPPKAACAVEFQGHIFLCNDPAHPDYLWYSKRFQPESFPPDQFLKIGDPSDPLLSMISLTGVIGIFTYITKYRLFGNSVSGFTALEALNSRGVASANATLSTASGVAFVAKDGIWLTNFVEADKELSGGIQGLFYGQTLNGYQPVDVNTVAHPLSLVEYKRRLYLGYRDTRGQFALAVYSQDSQHWYHYNHDARVFHYEEDLDQLTVGSTSGFVSILETGTTDGSDPITLDVVLPPRGGADRFARKGYEWLGVECEGQAPWQVSVLVDGVETTTVTASGPRQKRYVRLPEHTVGHQWQASLVYTGRDTAALYALEVLETQHNQGQVWVEETRNPDLFLQILPGSPVPMPLQRRRFSFLTLDADTGEGGTWTADLYLDGVLAASVTIPEPHNKRLHALPPGLTGYEWYTRLRYSGEEVPLVHTLDVVDSGVSDGQVWIAAPWNEGGAYQTILPATEAVDPFVLKRFLYVQLDAEAGPGFWLLELYLDDVLRQQIRVEGNRTHPVIRLQPGLMAYTWRIVARYSTVPIPTLFRVQVLTQGLQVA